MDDLKNDEDFTGENTPTETDELKDTPADIGTADDGISKPGAEATGGLLSFLRNETETKSPTTSTNDSAADRNGGTTDTAANKDGPDAEFPGAEPITPETGDVDMPDPDKRKMRYQSLVKNFTRIFNSMLAPGLDLAYESSLLTQEEKNDLRMIRRAFKSNRYKESVIGTDYENYLLDQYEKIDEYESKLSKEEVDELIQSWNDWVGSWEKTMSPGQAFALTAGGIAMAHVGPILLQFAFKFLNVCRFDGVREFSFEIVKPQPPKTDAEVK